MKKYHSLLEKLPGEKWSIQFGAYVRADCVMERDDMREAWNFVQGTKFKIITTDGMQASINAAVEELNK